MTTVNIRLLRTDAADFEADFQRVLHGSAQADAAIEDRVAAIVDDVRQRGDAAVLAYTARFDGVQADTVAALEISQAELGAELVKKYDVNKPQLTNCSVCHR